MEIRAVEIDNKLAPVSGFSVYVVVEETPKMVHLFHPWTLVEFQLPADEYRAGVGASFWPENNSGYKFEITKLLDKLKANVQYHVLKNKAFPTVTAMKVIKELGGMTNRQVESLVKDALPAESFGRAARHQVKLGRQYRLAKSADIEKIHGRGRVVLDIIKEIQPASITAIISASDGKLDTKLPKNRVVTYFVNHYHRDGILEVIGEQVRIPS